MGRLGGLEGNGERGGNMELEIVEKVCLESGGCKGMLRCVS